MKVEPNELTSQELQTHFQVLASEPWEEGGGEGMGLAKGSKFEELSKYNNK